MSKSRKKSEIASVRVDWNAVGRRLRELRGFDLTQLEFAHRIGVSQNYLSTMERGRVEIGTEILLRISLECGKTLEWLLTGEDRPR
jgi:transcriptional regulator with XRE-family HTH domain